LYLDKREDVERYLHVMENICVHGKPPDDTAEVLGQIAKETGDA
jgi:hypothetical protein